MTFYVEPEYMKGPGHPTCYRLCATGPGRFHGDYGLIRDAELAHLIVDLLNADDKQPTPAKSDGRYG
jgi:hypothetical protein